MLRHRECVAPISNLVTHDLGAHQLLAAREVARGHGRGGKSDVGIAAVERLKACVKQMIEPCVAAMCTL